MKGEAKHNQLLKIKFKKADFKITGLKFDISYTIFCC